MYFVCQSCAISSSWSTAVGCNITPSLLSVTCALCIRNILIFLLWLKFPECLNLIWIITNAFVFLAVRGILNNLLHVYSSKASIFLLPALHSVHFCIYRALLGKIIACASLTFVLVDTLESLMIYEKFGIAGLPKLILFLISSLLMRALKKFAGCYSVYFITAYKDFYSFPRFHFSVL